MQDSSCVVQNPEEEEPVEESESLQIPRNALLTLEQKQARYESFLLPFHSPAFHRKGQNVLGAGQ